MKVARLRKGWCPALLDPMPSGDGWLVRVKPSASTVSATAARALAQAARSEGSGQIDLTSRANLQIRGLSPRSAGRFAELMIAEHLASPDPHIERIRNVVASPLGPDDAAADFDSHALAREIEAMLASEPRLQALPAKFGFLVDGGGRVPLQGSIADIMIRARSGALTISPDGAEYAACCDPTQMAEVARKLCFAFLELAGGKVDRLGRMRTLVEQHGAPRLFDAARLELMPLPSAREARRSSPVGFIPSLAETHGAFGAGLAFGRIDAEALARLAALAETYGDGTLRLSPWRTILLTDVRRHESATLAKNVQELGLITDPLDSRLQIFACVGSPACSNASIDTREIASRIAAIRASRDLDVHVSGCAKGCAHHAAAAFTLVGRDGGYDLIRNGGPDELPELAGLSGEQAIAHLSRLAQGDEA